MYVGRVLTTKNEELTEPVAKENKKQITLPKQSWRTALCEVCGKPFDFLGKRTPHTCRSGDCLYKYAYKIDLKSWASYQPTLFDNTDSGS